MSSVRLLDECEALQVWFASVVLYDLHTARINDCKPKTDNALQSFIEGALVGRDLKILVDFALTTSANRSGGNTHDPLECTIEGGFGMVTDPLRDLRQRIGALA